MPFSNPSISNFLYRYSWMYRYYADNKADELEFRKVYDISPCKEDLGNKCIAMFNGKSKLWAFDFHGGFADRLKGMISIYKICKETGHDYKILHTLPFNLEDYLEPNQVDWRISEDEVIYNINAVSPHWLRHSPSSADEEQYFYWRLRRLLQGHRTQHIYSNALIVNDKDFRLLFKELFKPSSLLQTAIEKNESVLRQNEYISLSFRFTHLLGDPIDVYMKELDEIKKGELLSKAINSIFEIHRLYPDYKLLVNSDSLRFLSAVDNENLSYIYIIPGVPVHIDQQFDASEADFLKTFVDFYMISRAAKVFLIRIGEMRNSGFPKCAAMVGGKPYQVLRYE